MEPSEETVVVIFRRWGVRNGGGVIAIFPEIDAGGGLVQMYEHVGQHGGGNYQMVVERTKPTSYDDPDVVALQRELESLGYELRPRKRAKWHEVRTKR